MRSGDATAVKRPDNIIQTKRSENVIQSKKSEHITQTKKPDDVTQVDAMQYKRFEMPIVLEEIRSDGGRLRETDETHAIMESRDRTKIGNAFDTYNSHRDRETNRFEQNKQKGYTKGNAYAKRPEVTTGIVDQTGRIIGETYETDRTRHQVIDEEFTKDMGDIKNYDKVDGEDFYSSLILDGVRQTTLADAPYEPAQTGVRDKQTVDEIRKYIKDQTRRLSVLENKKSATENKKLTELSFENMRRVSKDASTQKNKPSNLNSYQKCPCNDPECLKFKSDKSCYTFSVPPPLLDDGGCNQFVAFEPCSSPPTIYCTFSSSPGPITNYISHHASSVSSCETVNVKANKMAPNQY